MNTEAPTESNFHLQLEKNQFKNDVIKGLSLKQKKVSTKYLYDKAGSEIFEALCKLNDYYIPHAEAEIIQTHGAEIAIWFGNRVALIEPGCGSCTKVRKLLPFLDQPAAYIGMDISMEYLLHGATELQAEFPDLPVFPLATDYTRDFSLPREAFHESNKKVIFFPGSTLGNLDPHEASTLLTSMAKTVGKGGGLLIGIDLKKSPVQLDQAYNDGDGVIAKFNLNLLHRCNRELSANFDHQYFSHTAFYNPELGRVEMHLVSQIPHSVWVGNRLFHFHENETIHTASSYKYYPLEMIELAATANFQIKQFWKDKRELFCLYYFERGNS